MTSRFLLLFFAIASLCLAVGPADAWTRWRVSNMRYCGGKPDQLTFDGSKSTVAISKDRPCVLAHTIRYTDLVKDTFVLKLGRVSPGVTWEVSVIAPEADNKRRTLMSGKGGGTFRAPFSRLGFPRWLATNVVLSLRSDTPATAEVVAWEIDSPGPDPNSGLYATAYKQLAKANPLERGLVPHWSTKIGAFVCAFNATHPEHYNFWLEDEGEALWSLGNYPDLMKLYGRGLRDFIVKYCKYGAPVRRVNDQPLLIHQPSAGGRFTFDTGPLVVEGDLSKDPHVNLHHGTYEMSTIATLAGFYVAYDDAQGVAHRIDFTNPSSYDVRYDAPKRDASQLIVRAADGRVSAEFIVVGYRGAVRVQARVTNLGDEATRGVEAGFALRDCDKYYRSPLNSHKQFGDVAILWSEQPMLEFCTIARVAGPAARSPILERNGGNITRAGFSMELADHLARGASASAELAYVQAGSRSFAQKIDIYKDIDFEDADISMSFVNTYALLGLATWSYRFPEDREARQVVDLMIGNFLGARERLRNRELGYLMWVLSLLGRDADAATVADLVEKRAAVDKYTPLDMAGMTISLRRVGRWDAADRICNALENKAWTGVAQPADFLGLGATHSARLTARSLSQLSAGLRSMVWDSPDRLTFHSHATVEEAASEAQSYMLVAFDLISRLRGGVVPVRLGLEPETLITRIDYDATSGECRIGLAKAGEIDIFTTYRRPVSVLWQGRNLDPARWRYDAVTGAIRIIGLSGEGDLTIRVSGAPPEGQWPPIDYIGLGKKPR